MKTLKFGIAGTAYWAANVQMVGLQRVKGAKLTAIWGRDPAKSAALAEKWGARAYADFDAMLAEVDVVSFALPPMAQEQMALRAIAAGKHVLLEKPMATNLVAARRLAAEIRKYDVTALVFFTRRFFPELVAAAAEAKKRKWRNVTVEILSAAFSNESPYRDSFWRRDSGAELWDLGPHILSLLIEALGPVTAQRALPSENGYSRFETIHESGAMATSLITLSARPEDRCNRYIFDDGETRMVFPDLPPDYPSAYVRAIENLISLIAQGKRAHPLDAEFGVETTAILEAIDTMRKSSSRSGESR